jgi:hypothetical protein
MSFGLSIKLSRVEIWAKIMKQKMTLSKIDWRTIGEDTWNVIKNHSKPYENKDGNTMGTSKVKNIETPPSRPPQKKTTRSLECMLSLIISCMKFLFLKLFACCHFQLG